MAIRQGKWLTVRLANSKLSAGGDSVCKGYSLNSLNGLIQGGNIGLRSGYWEFGQKPKIPSCLPTYLPRPEPPSRPGKMIGNWEVWSEPT